MDLSNIDRLEERQKAAAAFAELRRIEAAKDDATAEIGRQSMAEQEKEWDLYQQAMAANAAKFKPQREAIEKPFDEQIEALHFVAYPDNIMTDDDYEPVICAASGLAIFEDDEVLRDDDSGEVYLRAALGLPLKAKQQAAA